MILLTDDQVQAVQAVMKRVPDSQRYDLLHEIAPHLFEGVSGRELSLACEAAAQKLANV
jgi:hypothetical protein